MKKIIFIFILVCSIFSFSILNVNAASNIYFPDDDICNNNAIISDGDCYYSASFKPTSNYDYLQLYIESLSGNSVLFYLEKKDGSFWLNESEIKNSSTLPSCFINDNSGTGTYIMFCGGSDTNYVTPQNVNTNKVKSVVCGLSYGLEANSTYRIVVFNPKQWNGKTAKTKFSISYRNV